MMKRLISIAVGVLIVLYSLFFAVISLDEERTCSPSTIKEDSMTNHFSFRVIGHLRRSLPGLLLICVSMIASGLLAAPTAQAATSAPTPAHVVVVMEENHSYNEIIGSSSAPYINSLAASGALFTQSFAITHPSEPRELI